MSPRTLRLLGVAAGDSESESEVTIGGDGDFRFFLVFARVDLMDGPGVVAGTRVTLRAGLVFFDPGDVSGIMLGFTGSGDTSGDEGTWMISCTDLERARLFLASSGLGLRFDLFVLGCRNLEVVC